MWLTYHFAAGKDIPGVAVSLNSQLKSDKLNFWYQLDLDFAMNNVASRERVE